MKKTPILALALAALSAGGCGRESGRGSAAAPAPPEVSLVAKKTFYENNPTYRDDSSDDGFFVTATPASQRIDARKLAAAADALAREPAAFSMLVLRGGFLVSERYFNGSSAQASNNIHSASKGILSALVGIALDRGDVPSLDAPLSTLLPDYRYKDAKHAGITLKNMMEMTAGFKWSEDGTEYEIEQKDDWIQAIIDLPLASTPGKAFNYSSGVSHLVSAALTQATGKSTRQYAEEHLFRPLGIKVQHWGSDPQGYQSGGYNLYMTARALAKCALLFRDDGALDGRQVVPRQWLKDAKRPTHTADSVWKYGRYWWLTEVAGHPAQKLWGYGGQFVYLLPDLDLTVVLTRNTSDDFGEFDGEAFLADHLLPAVRD